MTITGLARHLDYSRRRFSRVLNSRAPSPPIWPIGWNWRGLAMQGIISPSRWLTTCGKRRSGNIHLLPTGTALDFLLFLAHPDARFLCTYSDIYRIFSLPSYKSASTTDIIKYPAMYPGLRNKGKYLPIFKVLLHIRRLRFPLQSSSLHALILSNSQY